MKPITFPKKCIHGFVPEFGPKPKNWKGRKGNIYYWLCMYCGTKQKKTPKEFLGRGNDDDVWRWWDDNEEKG